MSGSVTTLPSWQWSAAPQDLLRGLNATALPKARVDEVAVTDREMVAADVQAIAATVPALPRQLFTVGGSDVVCNHLTTTTLGTVAFAGAVVGDYIVSAASSPIQLAIFAEILSAGVATVKARNILPATDVTVLAATTFELVKISP